MPQTPLGLNSALAPHTNIMQHSFAYTAGKMWNALPMNVICAFSFRIFKLNLSCIYLDDLYSGGTP